MTRPAYRSELVGTVPILLLTLRYAGREVLLSTSPCAPVDRDGRVRPFGGGLPHSAIDDTFTLFEQEAPLRSVPFEVVFPGMDVALMESRGHDLTAATGELSRWVPGSAWEDRQVLLDGQLVQPEYGTGDEPVRFSLEELPYDDQYLIPDSTAIVSTSTWPSAHESALGAYYPEIIGAPGVYDAQGVQQVVPGSPALVVVWDGTYVEKLLLAGHKAGATSVTIFNSAGDSYSAGAVVTEVDGLGRYVTTVDISGWSAANRADPSGWYAAWTGGGGRLLPDETGAMDGAGEVLAYYLSRSSVRVDLGRVAAAATALNAFKVATYIDAPIAPLELVRRFLLPWLPVSITSGAGGLAPVVWRYWASRRDAVEDINADTPGVVRVGGIRRTRSRRDVANEIRVSWAYDAAAKAPRRLTVLKASPDLAAGEYTSKHVQNSALQYGASAKEWLAQTCDGATVARVADWLSRAYATVPRVVTYDTPPEYGWLDLGEIVTVTDTEVHIAGDVGLLTGRTWMETGVRLTVTLGYG